jgi:release factor glutamine methyltransferase
MIGDLLPSLRQSLEPFSETASLDAQVLLAHILEKPRSWVLAHPEAVLSSNQVSALDLALEHLLNGEPLPYVLGHWEFSLLQFPLRC